MTGPNSPHPFFPRKKPPKFLAFLAFLFKITILGYLQWGAGDTSYNTL